MHGMTNEACGNRRRLPLHEELARDIRYALRTMAGNRAFTALAALSLALGIGANTAIYSFMESILLRSLPVSDPASLVVVKWRSGVNGLRSAQEESVSGAPAIVPAATGRS